MESTTPNLAQNLICIHKVITRGIAVGLSTGEGYLKTGFPVPQERLGYSSYTHCLATVLGAHHTGEDQIGFPEFKKVLPSAPYAQFSIDHHKVEMLLIDLRRAITDLSGDTPDYGLQGIVNGLDKISEIWYPHIKLEEENFSEKALNSVFSNEEQKRISDAVGKHSSEHSEPPYWVIPFVLFNLERTDRETMAATIPPTVVNELVPIVWKDQWAPMKPYLLE